MVQVMIIMVQFNFAFTNVPEPHLVIDSEDLDVQWISPFLPIFLENVGSVKAPSSVLSAHAEVSRQQVDRRRWRAGIDSGGSRTSSPWLSPAAGGADVRRGTYWQLTTLLFALHLLLTCDASKDAMGAALLQEDRPLAFASASFSDSQKQYSQIEKELLSVYYGCKKDTHPMDELPTPFLEDKRMVKMVRVNISDEKLVAMQKDTREDPALNQLPPPQKLNIRSATVQRWASHPQPRYSGQVKRPILTRGKARLHPLGLHQNHPEGPGFQGLVAIFPELGIVRDVYLRALTDNLPPPSLDPDIQLFQNTFCSSYRANSSGNKGGEKQGHFLFQFEISVVSVPPRYVLGGHKYRCVGARGGWGGGVEGRVTCGVAAHARHVVYRGGKGCRRWQWCMLVPRMNYPADPRFYPGYPPPRYHMWWVLTAVRYRQYVEQPQTVLDKCWRRRPNVRGSYTCEAGSQSLRRGMKDAQQIVPSAAAGEEGCLMALLIDPPPPPNGREPPEN
ncbi:K02A2.6-like [Cordylochernes scorpioides]|uniref:K02A2.6-like n=1 Tax=Cordylochernes scorpioides TaxID=51811 RepID=A0ABY6KKH8_9ARAC|nr:K02A2.6-like [Cordylochernes scorpioides]